MGRPGSQTWTWTLCVLLSWMCVDRVLAGPQYMVAIPAVLEAGSESRFCASLLQPNETLLMTVKVSGPDYNATLLEKSSDQEFHECVKFQVPMVERQNVYNFKVEVKGNTFHSQEVRKVMAKFYQPMTFIQSDKPIYLPGQTVHFRVVSLDTQMRPVHRMYNVIEIEDNGQNRIAQWLNQTSKSSILQRSFTLNPEAREGTYQVVVRIGENPLYHTFKVEKYVLPKFDLKINAPDEVSIGQEEFKAEVCAKYTYGQPVPGVVEMKACRPFNHYYGPLVDLEKTESCYQEKKPTDKKGCATFDIGMSAFTKVDQKILQDNLYLTATLEEDGTGVLFPQQKRMQISFVTGRLSFIDPPKVYHEGAAVEGKVKALYYNNTPMAHMSFYLLEGQRWSPRLLQNLTTDGDGVAAFSFNSSILLGDGNLHASPTQSLSYPGYRTPHVESAAHSLSPFKPPSQFTRTFSALEVGKMTDGPLACHAEEELFIEYALVGEQKGTLTLMYLVLARGAIILQGFKRVEVEGVAETTGKVSFKLNVKPELAPAVQVLAYAVLPSENVIAKNADFATEKCFSNKVSLDFSVSSAVPGEAVTMQVTAQPESLCGVSAVDTSVLVKEPGKTLEAHKIFDLLPVTESSHIPYEVTDSVACLNVRPRRSSPRYPPHVANNDDAYSVFQNLGLKMATNLFVRMPSCLKFRGQEYHQGSYAIDHRVYDSPMVAFGEMGTMGMSPREPFIIETVRTFFPETWIWDLVEVGASGTKDVPVTVPDTITSWETEAFCLSPQGFGLAPRKNITVFQPFFVELTLPYSIIRGEHFELKATTFNYLPSCIMVKVTPTPSTDYNLTPLSAPDQYSSCVCGSERKTLSWTLAPSSLGVVNVTVSAEAVPSDLSCNNEIVSVPERGRMDVVTRSLVVKAEGTEVTKNYNWLLCPKGGALTEDVELQLPENVIVGSARGSFSVLGDILGRALKNLDGLLQMPYGCGEQNMALLAPNIYILQYLKNTQQLTAAILDKATGFLSSGYQRQLNYEHPDGAYSTFGSGDGNTWLTAFVLRSFAKAKSFVFIDPRKMEVSRMWLENKQLENGCFLKIGKLFNNRMKGGVSDEVTLSAYITAAFLEMNQSVADPVVNRSLSCLRESLGDMRNTYSTALLAYVFTLAGDMETRARLLDHLDTVAITEGGLVHWSQEASETSQSLSVEISSYVILARLGAAPTVEDLGYAAGIVRWLTGQQNYYGGFSSTQDTVVALQALALYSTLVFSPGGSSTVTLQGPSQQLSFDVNQDNKLVYMERELRDVTGKFGLEVKGSTCASMQISLTYNIPTPTDTTTLSVVVKPEAECTGRTGEKLTLMLTSLYSGNDNSSNMVILDIKVLSGFVPVAESLTQLKGALLIDRVEQKDDHVLVYIQDLPKDIPLHHRLDLQQQLVVQNLKPAVVQLYDYYQPSDQAETEYTFPCAAA